MESNIEFDRAITQSNIEFDRVITESKNEFDRVMTGCDTEFDRVVTESKLITFLKFKFSKTWKFKNWNFETADGNLPLSESRRYGRPKTSMC